MRLLSFFLCLLCGGLASAADFDLLVRNARIVDGSGNPWFRGDLGVKAGRIAGIGNLSGKTADRVVDARNRVLAPGFIDVHTHSEAGIVKRGAAENFLRDGVTTVVTGNCGGSELDVAAFFRTLSDQGIGINLATLVGHNSIRREVIGSGDRAATPQEIARMRAMIEKAMREGAVGFSTGLEYVPGMYTALEEIVALAKVAAKHDGVYASHLRDEGDQVLEAIEEALQVGKQANLRVQISHLKQDTKAYWGNTGKMIALIEKYRGEGVEATADQYPYIAYSTTLGTTLPRWSLAGGQAELVKRLQDPATRKKIFAETLAFNQARGYSDFDYTAVASCSFNKSYEGKTIREIARLRGRADSHENDVETVLELMEQGGVTVVTKAMSEDDVANIMRYRNVAIASDGGVVEKGAGRPHPRNYGTNARVLNEYVRLRKTLSLEDAVRKMTSLPAQTFRFRDRGLLKEGFAADLVLFDPEGVRDNATFADPHQYSTGFDLVVVNGQVAVEEGQLRNAKAGRPLRRQ
ncbi:MAG: D-aminoacylase [Bryobacter sp.]|nr:D-aminoacylase [Bryobacter sp.]